MSYDPALFFPTRAVGLSIYNFRVEDMIVFDRWTLWFSVFSFFFAPFFWNIIARVEFHTHIFTKIFCGNKYIGCYVLAAVIFTLNLERDFAFNGAIYDQPYFLEANHPLNQSVALVLFIMGTILVLSSFWKLGITGTYLGDYFGILMEEKLTCFPFNTFNNPMYLGSVINLLAASIWIGSPTGVLLAAWSHFVYFVAVTYFEGPFTTYIYEQKALQDQAKSKQEGNTGKKTRKNKKKTN